MGEKGLRSRPEADRREEGADTDRRHQRGVGFRAAHVDIKDSYDRTNHRNPTENKWVNNRRRGVLKHQEGDQYGADEADRIGLEDIGSHAGAVTNIVTNVVCNGCGIARVIFVEVLLDFAHEIGADIGRLGVDASPETGKDTDEAGPEGEADEGIYGLLDPMETHSDDIKATDGEQSEADHEETGHCAAAECHAQGGLAVLQSPRSSTDIGHDGDTHADVTGGERTDSAEKESK